MVFSFYYLFIFVLLLTICCKLMKWTVRNKNQWTDYKHTLESGLGAMNVLENGVMT